MLDSNLLQVDECLDEVFPLIREHFAEFQLERPDALTIRMLSHYPESIRRFGTPVRTST